MFRLMRSMGFIGILGLFILGAMTTPAMSDGDGPADGFGLHVQAPHMMTNGEIGGPYHHYCKGISDEIIQCLLFESTDSKAPLIGVEYFVAKELAREEVPLITWNRNFHDHEVEIATGRVIILDVEDKNEMQAIAASASQTDGIIYQLWQPGQKVPDGTVTIPNSIGHRFRTE